MCSQDTRTFGLWSVVTGRAKTYTPLLGKPQEDGIWPCFTAKASRYGTNRYGQRHDG